LVVPLWLLARIFYREWVHTHKLNTEWQGPNDDLIATKMLLEDIAAAKERILIYGGETDNIYNKQEIIDAFKGKNIPVEMIFENPNVATSAMKDMSKENEKISLFTTKGKVCGNHFRVVDYNYVYFEKIHKPKEENRFFKRLPDTRFAPAHFANKFQQIQSSSERV